MYSYNEPATSKTYTLSLHDALPIFEVFTRKIVSENPATGEQLYEFDCASDDEVWTAVERAKLAQPGWKDRKSTRLNSSHVEISYAVFCLKKKKNNKVNR